MPGASDDSAAALRRHGPMLLRATHWLPKQEGWVLEPKWDGYRAITMVGEGSVQVMSRQRRPLAADALHDELAALLPDGGVLDGELVALQEGPQGPVQARGGLPAAMLGRGALHLVIFDVLAVGGLPLLRVPLAERREIAEDLLADHQGQVVLTQRVDMSRDAHDRLLELGFEGTVAKRESSLYWPGKRSSQWLKMRGPLR